MSQKIPAKKIKFLLEEMREISKMHFILFMADGELVAGTTKEEQLEESVSTFAISLAETQIAKGWIYFRVELYGGTEYVLLCSRNSDADNAYMIGRMAVCQIRNFFISIQEPENKMDVLRQIVKGELTGEKLLEKCYQLQFKTRKYMLYVIEYREDKDAILAETLRNLFLNSYTDYVLEMDGTRSVLIKTTEDIPDEDYEQYAKMIVDNIQTEAMIDIRVGYGETVDGFAEMSMAYQRACTALRVGTVFGAAKRVFCFQQLGIGRLIYQLPRELCEQFLKEVLGENMDIDFDDETLTTINQLLDHNLNISETARQLYIHRNTLVYRLERIEKRLGLDIRTFEDAMLFKIAMMVRMHLNDLKKQG